MNLKRLGRFLGVIAAVAMLAMVVQGCSSSGGDNNSVQQDLDALQDAVDMALNGTDAMTVAELRTMYNTLMTNYDTLMGAVNMALDDTDAMDVAAFRTMYNSLMSDYNTLMNAVTMALADTGADTPGGFRTMYNTLMTNYNTLMGDYNTLMDDVEMALADSGADTPGGFRTMYDTLMERYDTLMGAVDMALEGIEANDVEALRTAYNTLKTNYETLMGNYNTLMGDVTMALMDLDADTVTLEDLRMAYDAMMTALADLPSTMTVQMLRDAYNANMMALMDLDAGTTVQMLRDAYNANMMALMGLDADTTVQMLRTAYNMNDTALMGLADDMTVQDLRNAYNANMTALMGLDAGTTVQMLREAYNANMMALMGLDAGTTVQMLRDTYNERMTALNGLPAGTTLADLRAAYDKEDREGDQQGNLDARRDAQAIQYLAGRTARDLDGNTTIEGLAEAAIAPMPARRNATVMSSVWVGCSNGMMCPETRITMLRNAATVTPWSSVVRKDSTVSFEVVEGVAAVLDDDDTNDDGAVALSRVKAEAAPVSAVSGYEGWVSTTLGGGLGGGGTENFAVYTTSKEVPFGDADSIHPYDASPDAMGDDTLLAVPAAEIGVTTDQTFVDALALTDAAARTEALDAWVAGLVATVEFTSELTTGNLVRNIADGSDEAVDGTFGGVSGKFYCQRPNDATDCQITRNVVGSRAYYTVATGDDWFFRPDDGSMVSNQDYMVFGAWLSESAVSAGHRTAGAFADGGEPFSNDPTALMGEAEYKGPAAGYYAERTAGEPTASSGQFVATAELTADFDATPGSGSLMGKIKDFYVNSNMKDWEINLGAAEISGTAPGLATGTTMGAAGSRRWTGTWGAAFFGGDADAAADAAMAHPTGVAGTFNAAFGDPHPLVSPSVVNNDKGVPLNDIGFVGVVGGFGADLVVAPMMEDDS